MTTDNLSQIQHRLTTYATALEAVARQAGLIDDARTRLRAAARLVRAAAGEPAAGPAPDDALAQIQHRHDALAGVDFDDADADAVELARVAHADRGVLLGEIERLSGVVETLYRRLDIRTQERDATLASHVSLTGVLAAAEDHMKCAAKTERELREAALKIDDERRALRAEVEQLRAGELTEERAREVACRWTAPILRAVYDVPLGMGLTVDASTTERVVAALTALLAAGTAPALSAWKDEQASVDPPEPDAPDPLDIPTAVPVVDPGYAAVPTPFHALAAYDALYPRPAEVRPLPAASDDPECPGEDCKMCNGEACNLCGAGCWDHRVPPAREPCEHSVDERHQAPATTLPADYAARRAAGEDGHGMATPIDKPADVRDHLTVRLRGSR